MKPINTTFTVVLTISSVLFFSSTLSALGHPQDGNHSNNLPLRPGRDPNQPIDEEYTQKIREYTTEKFFSSPLVDYLPASKTVPTPKVAIGDVAGAPGKLPYSHEVYTYMRMLE